MNQELQDWLDARKILGMAYYETIGIWPAHDKIYRAMEHVDRQTKPIIEAALNEVIA